MSLNRTQPKKAERKQLKIEPLYDGIFVAEVVPNRKTRKMSITRVHCPLWNAHVNLERLSMHETRYITDDN